MTTQQRFQDLYLSLNFLVNLEATLIICHCLHTLLRISHLSI